MQPKTDNLDAVAGQKTLILGGHDFHSITQVVSGVLERPAPLGWWAVFALALLALGGLGIGVPWLVWEGIGVWGLNVPVGWAWDITNFVFWIGIGHAGTLISAILLLFRQKWRTSINRAAEAMTLFAVVCALIYPGIHVGRVWVAYWMAPLPNQMGVWPNFRSPLLWDVFAVEHLRHGVAAVLVRRPGARPRDVRDRAKTKIRQWIYGALGARLARLEAPLAALRDGLPDPGRPLDAAGAVGALDRVVGLRRVAAARLAHDDLPALLRRRRDLLRLRDGADADGDLPQGRSASRRSSRCATSTTWRRSSWRPARWWATPTRMEFFIAWYSGNPYERFAFINRAIGPVRLGLLDDGDLQRDRAAALLVQEDPTRACWRCS